MDTKAGLSRKRTVAAAAIVVLCTPGVALATLGQGAASIDADRIRAQGALTRITSAGTHTVHEIQSASGVLVREYVDSNGVVFGVAWQGPWMPDLQQLLGPYFEAYQAALAAARARRGGHGPLTVTTPDIVVQLGGRQRAFVGSAYVPRFIPPTMQAQSIR
jgi:hypothetical protein